MHLGSPGVQEASPMLQDELWFLLFAFQGDP